MIKLEFEVTPSPTKIMELHQTLEYLASDMQDCCSHFEFFQSGNGKSFFIVLSFTDKKQLNNIIQNSKMIVLSGAISSLCEAKEIFLNGIKINELSVVEYERVLQTKKQHLNQDLSKSKTI